MNELQHSRRHKDEFLRSDPHSPLPAELREEFQGLDYYDENSALRFDADVEPFAEHTHVHMQTSTGDAQEFVKFGKFHFDVDGQPASLTVYASEDGGAFLPFADATSGTETYGAGRYLELAVHGDNRFHVDFNLAYNPWCAYSPEYSCPFPPAENRLQVPIRAGEKDFRQNRVAGENRCCEKEPMPRISS